MGFTVADRVVIKNELTNNTLALTGYLPISNEANDEANADALNLVRTQTKIDREAIPISEMVLAVDADEYLALSPGQQNYLAFITNAGVVNPKSGNEVREALLQFFGLTSETRGKLLAMVQEQSSRITQLYKAGTLSYGGAVSPGDVAQARSGT